MIRLFLFLLLAAAAPGEDLRLSLHEAVNLALKQNPQVQIANLNIALSEQDRRVARAALLPQAQFETTEAVHRTNLETLVGRSFPGFASHVGPFEVFQTGASFSAPLFDLSSWRRFQASREAARATQGEEQTTREQIVALVVSQYLASQRAAADVSAAQSRVDLARALYDQAADLQKSGVGTGIDTLRANVSLQNERQRLITAETQLRTSLFGLARLLNLDPRRNIQLADEVSFFETPAPVVEQSLDAALANRPERKVLLARAREAELRTRGSKGARLPSVRVNGNYGQLGLAPQSVIPSYQYGIEVDMPLFTGGRIGAEIARAEIEEKRIARQREEVEAQIALEVRTATAQLEAARNEVEVANLGVSLAREEVTQARDRFQAGVANNIEVISAQDALARANDNQIVALYRYNQARADLARATGQMEKTYEQ